MTDPKNTEDQELSLDQLKDAAGGISADARGKTAGTSLQLEPEAGDDVLKKNAESLRSDNRF